MTKQRLLITFFYICFFTSCFGQGFKNTQLQSEMVEIPEATINVVQHFEPLEDNEKLSYRIIGNDTMQLYAIKNNILSERRLIIEWENVIEYGGIQFANNRRDCFFMINDTSLMSDEGFYLYPSYYLNGKTGTIEYIKNVAQPVTITTDGRFILYRLNSINDGQIGIFAIFSISEKKDIHEFSWELEKNEFGSFYFRRELNGKLKILYVVEGCAVVALAKIDPNNRQFTIEWDLTNVSDVSSLKDADDPEFLDDLTFQWLNSLIKLEF